MFNYCEALTSVTVEMTTPPSIADETFSNRANATLYVPKGCKAAYEAADYWKEFKEIVETSNSKLYAEETDVRCGSQSVIPVVFESGEDFGGLQCEVLLPEGMTLSEVTKTERLSDVFTLAKNKTGDNTYQILLYNISRESFTGNDGALFNLVVDVADGMAVGDYEIQLREIVASDVAGMQEDLQNSTSVVHVDDYMVGDANRDNRVNVTDIMTVANKILKMDVANFNEKAADVNGDGVINVADIMGIANIILQGSGAQHAPAIRQEREPQ